jgi:hypothetical protein
MAVLAVTDVLQGGVAVTYQAAAASDTFVNDGNTRLRAKNASGAPINVTINSVQPCTQGFDHDMIGAVPANGEMEFGPFPLNRYGSPVGISTPTPASITYAVIRG